MEEEEGEEDEGGGPGTTTTVVRALLEAHPEWIRNVSRQYSASIESTSSTEKAGEKQAPGKAEKAAVRQRIPS